MPHGPDPRPYVVGAEGPGVFVPADVASWLFRNVRGLQAARTAQRGRDDRVSSVLLALRLSAMTHDARREESSPAGQIPAPRRDAAPESFLTTRQAADLLGISPRAVRHRIKAGLPAELVAGRLLVRRADLQRTT